jgi:hypothetical protein
VAHSFQLIAAKAAGKSSLSLKIKKVIDRIIGHFELTSQAELPPPPHQVQQDLLMAAEESGEYF